MHKNNRRTRLLIPVLMMLMTLGMMGCPEPPQTVSQVNLTNYLGLWYQVAGYPFFPTRDQVGITADYTALDNGNIGVFNSGFEGSLDGPEKTIVGEARVVDPITNAKLAVSFPSVFFGLFEGQYWIIDLDEEGYSYAVVSDSSRSTLFILSRTPQMDDAVYAGILERLAAQGYDLERIVAIPQPES